MDVFSRWRHESSICGVASGFSVCLTHTVVESLALYILLPTNFAHDINADLDAHLKTSEWDR